MQHSRASRTHATRQMVALLIEPDDTWGRDVMEGVAAYARSRSRWTMLIAPRDRQGRLRLPRSWRGDGVIVSLRSRSQANNVRAARVPVVDVSYAMPKEIWLARVIADDRRRAEMAFEHLRARGFQQFAYFGPPSRRYSAVRGREFQRVVQEAGWPCSIYQPPRPRREQSYAEQHRCASKWLSLLPRPVAIFTADPFAGRQLAEICRDGGVRVPEEVAILAGDTDELMCTISSPSLSSIVLASRRIGFEAARLLEALMCGTSLPRRPQWIEPSGVAARESTDILAIEDSHLVSALRHIREHATEGISVRDVLRTVPISRRKLEQLFTTYLSRSPAEEIRRVQLEHAANLLVTTNCTVLQAAMQSGFANSSRLCEAFRRVYQTTPSAYRARLRC